MKFFDVLYYNYYLFQTKIISRRGTQPHIMTILTLSGTEFVLAFGIINFISVKNNCKGLESWTGYLIIAPIIFFNYLLFKKSGRSRKIIPKKPVLINKTISIIITALFFIISFGCFYGLGMLSINMLHKCR